jgi:hypothetical protein
VRVASVELRASQLDEDVLDQWRDLVEHALELIDFSFLLVDVLLDLDSPLLIFRRLIQNPLFLLIIFLQLLILSPEVLVDIDKIIDFLVEDIHICQQIIVLFFSFDEGVLNL